MLTTSSRKRLGEINHTHIVSLLYKLLISFQDKNDLSIGFDRDRVRTQRELTNDKIQRGKYHVRIMLGDVFGFAENQEKCTFVLGSKLPVAKRGVNAVFNKDIATNISRIKINSIEWYVYHIIYPVFHYKLYYLNGFK